MGTPVAFNTVIRHIVEVVVVEVDGDGNAVCDFVRRAIRIAIRGNIDAVVPIRRVVISYDVTLAIDLDRVFRSDLRGKTGELRPDSGRIPTLQFVRIVPADENVVGNVIVF
ncbi:MAG: hypothetical protein JO266_01200 [Acidobacteria bacterium]|nr:hypothetical protein [Acidobacteriota bacterium]